MNGFFSCTCMLLRSIACPANGWKRHSSQRQSCLLHAIAEYPPFSYKDPKTGEWTGFDIELFRKVATAGQFEFEITQLRLPAENETYNTILYNEGREFDMMVSWYVFSTNNALG
eukprot:scaffold68205_cov23-Tisochrysis_lutea.AAC.1